MVRRDGIGPISLAKNRNARFFPNGDMLNSVCNHFESSFHPTYGLHMKQISLSEKKYPITSLCSRLDILDTGKKWNPCVFFHRKMMN